VASLLAHDLKNPLSAILMGSSMLLRQPTDAERVSRHAEAIQRAGRRMERLLGDLLDLDAAEAGRLKLELRPHAAGPLLDEIRALVEPLAARRQVQVKTWLGPDDPSFLGDRKRLMQVLEGLTERAARLSPPGTQVVLRALRTPAGCRFLVEDAGPTLSEEDRQRLVEIGPAAPTGGPRRSLGPELALLTARVVATAHGGQLLAEDRGGLRFAPLAGETAARPAGTAMILEVPAVPLPAPSASDPGAGEKSPSDPVPGRG
jgi:signal transduction histidine kinase